jgi:putative NIF3 family GTP cyclohydrolase 1 type 2
LRFLYAHSATKVEEALLTVPPHRRYHWFVMHLSRRSFARLAGTAALAGPHLAGQHAPLTAQQAIDRIQKNAGVPWRSDSGDAIQAGDPATEITGIATTAMATMDVLTRASKENANFVVTLEPTFFGRLDTALAGDPVYAAKQQFVQSNRLVVWRFSDHWRTRKPDPLATGLARTLGWTKYQVGDDPAHYELPAVTLAALADHLGKQLHARAGIRVVGDPQSSVRRVSLLPGVSALAATMKTLPACDAIVAGETREWESVEYAQDIVASGQKKGLIMVGRLLSEDPAMSLCAEWLKSLIPEAPVRWLPAGDPYWRPS